MERQFEYVTIIHLAEEGGYWSGVPALPGGGSQGESVEETIANTRESSSAVLAVMKERGQAIAEPADIVVKVQVPA
ncbi:MAG TPA: type II toxin-antitoxin system HicB family antitoxin [Dehalococcoidia bacterium]|nr:type II toxin-antitoxin system HicB family antitoxin [Dehalococcoidia bacterium]